MIKFIGCVAEKYTAKPLSDVFEVVAYSVYDAADVLEGLTGIKIDGVTNYADLCEVEED